MMGGMGTSADASDAPTGPGHTPYLPEPTGPCPAGTTSLWLTDTSRPDPRVAGVSARELMVSLWYPAVPSSPTSRCWPIRAASTSAPGSPEPGPRTSPAPTSGPSSTSTCAARRKPCWTSRHHATPRSRSVPRRQKPARAGGPPGVDRLHLAEGPPWHYVISRDTPARAVTDVNGASSSPDSKIAEL